MTFVFIKAYQLNLWHNFRVQSKVINDRICYLLRTHNCKGRGQNKCDPTWEILYFSTECGLSFSENHFQIQLLQNNYQDY